MKRFNKLYNLINDRKTLLGVGPMSLNCVNAAINISNKNNIPIILIASRRQIDDQIFGGGYVNNWNTKDYVNYINKRDKKKNIFLARDHGGPWQNNLEILEKYSTKKALESAKSSFKSDIDNNFEIIHIDTCIDIEKKINFNNSFNRLCELYEFCHEYSKKKKKEIIFEIGTEEQSGSTNTPNELEETLKKFYKFCDKNKYQRPKFVVIQSGTRVAEMKNIGSFESPLRIENELPVEIQLPKMLEICKKYDIFMKEHNADYLNNDSLEWHPKLGIHSANVAPEFGITETKSLINILKKTNLDIYLDEFLEISYSSNKWKKWMLPNSKANDIEKAIIAGHYVFSDQKFVNLKKRLIKILAKKNINLEKYLEKEITKSILRYLKSFRLINKI
jgi:hypothetical protein